MLGVRVLLSGNGNFLMKLLDALLELFIRVYKVVHRAARVQNGGMVFTATLASYN